MVLAIFLHQKLEPIQIKAYQKLKNKLSNNKTDKGLSE